MDMAILQKGCLRPSAEVQRGSGPPAKDFYHGELITPPGELAITLADSQAKKASWPKRMLRVSPPLSTLTKQRFGHFMVRDPNESEIQINPQARESLA